MSSLKQSRGTSDHGDQKKHGTNTVGMKQHLTTGNSMTSSTKNIKHKISS